MAERVRGPRDTRFGIANKKLAEILSQLTLLYREAGGKGELKIRIEDRVATYFWVAEMLADGRVPPCLTNILPSDQARFDLASKENDRSSGSLRDAHDGTSSNGAPGRTSNSDSRPQHLDPLSFVPSGDGFGYHRGCGPVARGPVGSRCVSCQEVIE
jgi:hypothetical protein